MAEQFDPPNFEQALAWVLQHEGGWSDHPADPGGATQWGISLRLIREMGYDVNRDGDVDADDVAALTRADAAAIYRRLWWDRHLYGSLGSQLVAEKVFDVAVNMGASQGHRVLQRALRASGGVTLVEDGVVGPKTLIAARAADPWATRAALRSEAAGFYRLLAATKPSLAVFLNGWLRRAYW